MFNDDFLLEFKRKNPHGKEGVNNICPQEENDEQVLGLGSGSYAL